MKRINIVLFCLWILSLAGACFLLFHYLKVLSPWWMLVFILMTLVPIPKFFKK